MTQVQRDTIGGWWMRAKEIVAFATGITVILAAIYGGIIWLTGGFQTNGQIDLKDFRTQLTTIQVDQGKAAAAAQVAQDKIIARLDALPRPKDYADQDQHLHDIDHRLDGLDHDAVGVRHDLDNLMRPVPFRSPHL